MPTRDRSVVPRVHPVIDSKSLTQQQFKDEVDVNNITNRYLKTGLLGELSNGRQPMFGDFTSRDFHAMQNAIVDIDQQFHSLPSRIRKRFDNDPYQLIRFTEKPENRAECLKLGLLLPTEEELQDPFVDPAQTDLLPGAAKADPEANPSFKAPAKAPQAPLAPPSPLPT